MQLAKWIFVVAVFLGLCLGCFYIIEARHDKILVRENSELKNETNKAVNADVIVKKHLYDVLSSVYPETKDVIAKVIYDPRYDVAQALKDAADEKAKVNKKADAPKQEKKTNG